MTSVTRPRRRLPRRVYWFRRFLVLGVAAALVIGVAQLLGPRTEPTSGPAARAAAPVGSPTGSRGGEGSPQATPTGAPGGPTQTPAAQSREQKKRKQPTPTPLAVPTGPCADADVVVEPTVPSPAIAGTDITIRLRLTTATSPACTWLVAPESVVLRVSSGDDRVWSTQDCRNAVPRRQVVLRKDQPTTVDVVWSGQRSDDECSRTTAWALQGDYHATAAALGAEPSERQFRLLAPPTPTITPTPTEKPGRKPTAKPDDREDRGDRGGRPDGDGVQDQDADDDADAGQT